MRGPLPPSIKAPTHWLSVADVSIWTAVCPHKPLVASTQDKAEFPFYKSCLSISFWAVSSQTPPSVTILLGEGNTSHQSLGAQTYSWVERGGETDLGIRQIKVKNQVPGDFPSGPVAKTLCSQCRVPGFDPWSRNSDSTCCNQDLI